MVIGTNIYWYFMRINTIKTAITLEIIEQNREISAIGGLSVDPVFIRLTIAPDWSNQPVFFSWDIIKIFYRAFPPLKIG